MLQDRTRHKLYEKIDGLRKFVTDEVKTEVSGREIVDILRRATIEAKAVIKNQYGEPCTIGGEKMTQEEKKYVEHDIDVLSDIFIKSSEDKMDKTISDVGYILDCLVSLRNIQNTGHCNICKNKNGCIYKPEVGQMVRYNCPFYKEVEE